jgi:uncharacterized membrane protein YdbT with pleckstrin-like domain
MGVEDHLQPGETIVFRAHPTRIVLVPVIAAAIVAAGAGIAVYHATQNVVLLALAGFVVIAALVAALVAWVRLRSNEYILTTHRMIQQYGILSKRSVDSYLWKINNVEHGQSFWGRILGFGDVEIDTASQAGVAVFPRVAHPVEFKRAILAAVEAYHAAGAPAASAAPASPAAPAAPSSAERLRSLKKLLDDGLISAEEYETKRKQLVAEL